MSKYNLRNKKKANTSSLWAKILNKKDVCEEDDDYIEKDNEAHEVKEEEVQEDEIQESDVESDENNNYEEEQERQEDEETNADLEEETADNGEDLDDFIENDEYFEADKTSMIKEIASKLEEKYKLSSLGLGKKEIYESVSNILSKVGDDILKETGNVKPSDRTWKLGLTEDEIQKLEPELLEIRNYHEEHTPTLKKILEANMPDESKARAVIMFDILQALTPYTFLWYTTTNNIIQLIEKESVRPDLIPEYRKIKTISVLEEITLNKILDARIDPEMKWKAYELFKVSQLLTQKDDGHAQQYLELTNEIRQILKYAEEPLPPELLAKEAQLKAQATTYSSKSLKRKILELDTDERTRIAIYEMYNKLSSMTSGSQEFDSLLSKINIAVNLPYKKLSIPPKIGENGINGVLTALRRKLDDKLYGMNKVKQRLLILMNNKLQNPKSKFMIVLKGKAGTGKTSICMALSEVFNKPIERVALGGLQDASLFKGSQTMWIGSTPSIIVQFLRRAKCSDGILVLDELDKLGMDGKGLETQYSLLQVLDETQNTDFRDDFIPEIGHDISLLWILGTINEEKTIHPTLKDRMEILELEEYKKEDYICIIRDFLLRSSLKKCNLDVTQFSITREACEYLYALRENRTKLTGVRPLAEITYDLVSRLSFLKNAILPDGTLGELEINFKPIKYQEPLVIDEYIVSRILSDVIADKITMPSYIM